MAAVGAIDVVADVARAPWTVKAYLPVWFTWSVLFGFLDGGGFRVWPTITGVIIVGAIWYGMIRGFRGAWVVALVLLILPLLGLPGHFVRQLSLGFVSLVGLSATMFLLLHPLTRAWCWRAGRPMEKVVDRDQDETQRADS